MFESLLFGLTALIYIAMAFLCWPGQTICRNGVLTRLLPLLPLVLHLYLLHSQIFGAGGIRLGFATALSAMLALTVLFYSIATWRYALGGLQSLVLVLAGFGVMVQARMPQPAMPDVETPISGLHLIVAFGAYGTFMIAALHAVLIALAEKHLHKPVPPPLVAALPPLLTLEKMLFRMIELGMVVLDNPEAVLFTVPCTYAD